MFLRPADKLPPELLVGEPKERKGVIKAWVKNNIPMEEKLENL